MNIYLGTSICGLGEGITHSYILVELRQLADDPKLFWGNLTINKADQQQSHMQGRVSGESVGAQ